MFSGQGSQYYQMGKDLYDTHAVFRRVMDEGDKILQPVLHRSIVEELYKHPISKELDDLLISHPALLLVQYALFKSLVSEGIEPDFVWGASAGELAAAVAAEVLDLKTALLLVVEQAKILIQYCEKGGMLAILDEPKIYEETKILRANTTLAGINYSKNFIVAGKTVSLNAVYSYLKANEIVHQKLPVNYAFHSAEIDGAKEPFEDFCRTLPAFDRPKTAFLSSVVADQLDKLEQNYFWDVARRPILFQKMLTQLELDNPSIFIDCGPSGTLATFVKYGLSPKSGSSFFPILSFFQRGMRNLGELKRHL